MTSKPLAPLNPRVPLYVPDRDEGKVIQLSEIEENMRRARREWRDKQAELDARALEMAKRWAFREWR
jgi:hypothetical protein